MLLSYCSPLAAQPAAQTLPRCCFTQLLAAATAAAADACRLCIWRLVRGILQRPPPIEVRKSLGPSFVSSRSYAGDMAYNRSNPPTAPSYLTAQVQSNWSQRCAFNNLVAYCEELGLLQVGAVSAL
jgi:hypothetical protein